MAEWLVAVGTLALALVTAFQDSIRSWIRKPRLSVQVSTQPPDCVSVPMLDPLGQFITDCIYLRLWVVNGSGRLFGRSPAKQVEVYAHQLRRKQADGTWSEVKTFPPMNLKWSNLGAIYFPSIAPGTGKHCDLGHIADPSKRYKIGEVNPALKLTDQQVSLAFDLMVAPNHKGHIIGPGIHQLE